MKRVRRGRALLAMLTMLATTSCKMQSFMSPEEKMKENIDTRQPCYISHYADIPIAVVGNHIFAHAVVNGVKTLAVIDTGGAVTVVSPALAQKAKVEIQEGKTYKLRGESGEIESHLGRIDSLGVGGMRWNAIQMTNSTQKLGIRVAVFDISMGQGQVGVLIGLSQLFGKDYDIDFKRNVIHVYETNNCKQVIPVWDDTESGLPMTFTRAKNVYYSRVLGMNLILGDVRMSIPVQFETDALNALVDTGQGMTVISREAAHRLGITDTQLAADPISRIVGINGNPRSVRAHTISDMVVGEDEIHNFVISIPEDSQPDDYEMILGMDYLSRQRIWLSFGSQVFYIDSGIKRPIRTAPAQKSQ